MDKTSTAATALTLVAGSAFVTDTVTIAVLDSHFEPTDSILFFLGLITAPVGLALTAAVLTRGMRSRPVRAIGVVLATVAVTAVVGTVGQWVADHLYHGSNIGLKGEWFFFLTGVILLSIGALTLRRNSRDIWTNTAKTGRNLAGQESVGNQLDSNHNPVGCSPTSQQTPTLINRSGR